MQRLLTLCLLLGLVACRVDAAPQDLDGAMHAAWTGFDAMEDDEAAALVDTLHALVGGDTLDEDSRGALSPLVVEELAGLTPSPDQDPADAPGMLLVNPMACALEDLAAALIHLDQDELYPGVYLEYERVHDGDGEAFLAGETDRLGWVSDMRVEILGAEYTEQVRGDIRRVSSGARPFLWARTWLTGPAEFVDSDWSFEQDYQIELFWERAPGELVHAYGIWREMNVGGLSAEDEGFVNVTLNNMVDWDEQTVALCAEGRP
ncbi:MAG: hypothetical protein IPN01_12775 [Deltaproteobacteria bacterium]|nr:hypothetical protein [Deltaproteobacteria bacterium]